MKKLIPFVLLFFISACQSIEPIPKAGIGIGEVQGCSHISPYNGKIVTGLSGVVTHKFNNGFSMQSLAPDHLDCTSDGIFVMTGDYPYVLPGQLVLVDGLINEYVAGNTSDHDLSRTEIISSSITILKSSVPFPEPFLLAQTSEVIPMNWIKEEPEFDITKNGMDYYESLEFMLVEISDGVVVGPKNSFNEFYLLPTRFVQNNTLSADGALLQKADDANPEKIMIDTASSFTQKVNVGDSLAEPVIGIMVYEYANYKIWTLANPILRKIATNPVRVTSGEDLLSFVSYNIENFSRFDDENKIKKIGCQVVQELGAPDIVILQEVMDDSGTQDDQTISAEKTLQSIIESIRNCKGPDYTYLDTPPINNQNGGIQGGNIRVALLFRNDANISYSTRFEQMNYSDSVLNQLNLTTNPAMLFANEEVFLGTRKPLLWIFNWKDQEFIIIGLHLVSQSAKSPDWGNIQPPVNPEQEVREAQMLLVRDIVKKLLRENAERNIIVVGDLNDYQWSHTLSLLQEAGLEILKNDLSESFSYIHEGNAFQFDYAAVSSQLVVHIENYSILHVNTLQDKSTQVSDHDPVYFEVSQR
jgi:predicted extracellular nuclease